MKNYLYLMMAGGLLLAGCGSAYKMTETPDDVYYSYGQTAAGAEVKQSQEDEGYSSYFGNADDSYLRMKVQNRDKWSQIDDLNYWYGYNNPSMMGSMYSPFNMGYNNMHMWNSPFGMNAFNMGLGGGWYNPFAFNNYYNSWNNPYAWNRPVIFANKYPTGTSYAKPATPRASLNKTGYTNSVFEQRNYQTGNKFNSGKPPAGYGNSSLFRSIFSSGNNGGNNGSSQGYSRPSRLFENSGSTNYSGSSGGGSSRSSGNSSSSGSSSSSGGSRRGGNQ